MEESLIPSIKVIESIALQKYQRILARGLASLVYPKKRDVKITDSDFNNWKLQ